MAWNGLVSLVGRLEHDAVLVGGRCTLALAAGTTDGRSYRRDVHVVGAAAGRCAGLRAGMRVAVEGTPSGRNVRASRVVALDEAAHAPPVNAPSDGLAGPPPDTGARAR